MPEHPTKYTMSDCCHLPVAVHEVDEGTCRYVCMGCGNECDIAPRVENNWVHILQYDLDKKIRRAEIKTAAMFMNLGSMHFDGKPSSDFIAGVDFVASIAKGMAEDIINSKTND